MLQDNLFLSVVFLLYAFTAAIQIFYYLWFYLAPALHRHHPYNKNDKAVSVIICARNEAENLDNFLPYLLEQDYPDYEVIVVNDCSEDTSDEILGKYAGKYPHLKISTVNQDPRFTHNKKFAQFIGIKAASNDLLLFTDADCYPESKQWISCMVSHLNEKINFVLGYGGYTKKRGLLNRYIRSETFTIALQYLGMALRGIPYMGVGRNLAYHRSIFFNNRGFGKYNHMISGDDDLFVNTNARRSNTSVEFRKESHIRSVPPSSVGHWFAQKKRHLTTAPYYKTRDKVLLVTEPVSRLLFYISFIILIIPLFFYQFVLLIFGFRLIIQIIVFSLGKKKLNEPGILLYSLFFDIFSPLINWIVHISNTFTRSSKHKWK